MSLLPAGRLIADFKSAGVKIFGIKIS